MVLHPDNIGFLNIPVEGMPVKRDREGGDPNSNFYFMPYSRVKKIRKEALPAEIQLIHSNLKTEINRII